MCFVDPVPAGTCPTPGPRTGPCGGRAAPGAPGPANNKTNILLTCAGQSRAAGAVVPPPFGPCAAPGLFRGAAAHMRAGAAQGGHGAARPQKEIPPPAGGVSHENGLTSSKNPDALHPLTDTAL